MAIRWINTEEEGQAVMNMNYLTLNRIASTHLLDAYRVMIGFDDNDDIVIVPLTKEEVEEPTFSPEGTIYETWDVPGYVRIADRSLMRKFAEFLGVDFNVEKQVRFKTFYNKKDNHLVIKTGKKNK